MIRENEGASANGKLKNKTIDTPPLVSNQFEKSVTQWGSIAQAIHEKWNILKTNGSFRTWHHAYNILKRDQGQLLQFDWYYKFWLETRFNQNHQKLHYQTSVRFFDNKLQLTSNVDRISVGKQAPSNQRCLHCRLGAMSWSRGGEQTEYYDSRLN